MTGEHGSQISQYQHNSSCMTNLARSSGLRSAEKAGKAYGRLVPQLLAALSSSGQSTVDQLLVMARAFTWVERDTPEVFFANDEARFDNKLGPLLFAESLPAIVSGIVATEGVSEHDAGAFVEISSIVALCVMSGSPQQRISREALTDAIGADAPQTSDAPNIRAEFSTADTQPEQVGSAPTDRSATAAAPSQSVAASALVADDERSKLPLLIGAALAVTAGLIGFVLFGGGSDDSVTDQTATAGSDTETVLPNDSDTPEPENSAPPITVAEVNPEADESESTDAGEPDAVDEPEPVTADSDNIVSLSVPMVDIFDADRGASGVLNFDFDTATGEVCYAVESINIQGPYRTHIHVGDAGVKGGIVIDMGSLDSGDTGCVENLPIDTNAILAAKSGHYAELHDISEDWTIRGQLSEAITGDEPGQASSQVDLDGGGASIVLDGGTVYLEGAVPDQETADELSNSLSGINGATPVVNNLTVEANAPLPSGRVVIADAVFFAINSDEVRAIDDKTLSAITALALSREDWILTVVGHTDSDGSDVTNLELSLRRATALRDLLAIQGVPQEKLRIRGAGETAPIGDNATWAGRAENRRIEFEFTPSA